MLEVLALHAGHKGDSQAAGKERIFAVGLLAPPPARVAKDVDVRRPECEAIEDAVIVFPLRLVVLGAGLVGDDLAHALHNRWIPGRGHADGLGKHRGVAGARHAVQRFVPGLVVGNAEPGNRCGPVFKLVCLLLQGHAPAPGRGRVRGARGGYPDRRAAERLQSLQRCKEPAPEKRQSGEAASNRSSRTADCGRAATPAGLPRSGQDTQARAGASWP